MTKCNMPAAYCRPPVQKLVDLNTVTNLAGTSIVSVHFRYQLQKVDEKCTLSIFTQVFA